MTTEAERLFIPTQIGEGWEFTHPKGPRLVVDQIRPTSGRLQAWVELHWERGEQTRLLSAATRDLTGPMTAPGLARDAKGQIEENGFDWHELITAALYFVITKHREGKRTVDLHAVDDVGFQWMLRPWIETGGHMRLIAAGGSRKSYLALAIALAVATGSDKPLGVAPTITGPVLYLDWETQDDGRTHAYRLRAVARGAGVDLEAGLIHHQQHDLPLAERASAVANRVSKEGHALIVVDSNTMARGSGGRAGFEAATTDFLTALRIVGVPALIIDHKSKDQMDKGKTGGYGSIHNENQVRLQWEFTKVFPQKNPDTARVLIENTKQNNIAKQAAVSLEIAFDNDRTDPDRPRLDAVRFTPISADLVRGFHPVAGDDDMLSTSERVMARLRDHGPATVADIAMDIGVDRSTVTKAVANSEVFKMFGHRGQAKIWGLIEQDPNQELPEPM